MEQNQYVEYLLHFGLTRQEALIYVELLVKGKQTGYEIAKETGISRSNVYSVLAALAEVLEKCKKKALENGYENLDIQVVTSAAGSKYAKVTLAYRYTIPLLNMLLEHQITGYAK